MYFNPKRKYLFILLILITLSNYSQQWNPLGSLGFSPSEVTYVDMAINNDIIYVAYTDYANGTKASVKKYNGTNWG